MGEAQGMGVDGCMGEACMGDSVHRATACIGDGVHRRHRAPVEAGPQRSDGCGPQQPQPWANITWFGWATTPSTEAPPAATGSTSGTRVDQLAGA